jgi:tryptophanyl-tRNA synthetase
MGKKRIFSGIKPSGDLHLGNYLGAIRQWIALQDEYDAVFSVVDLHAITVSQDPKELHQKTLEIAKIYLSAGIDPEKCILFIQSHVKEHTELCWILNTVARMGDLEKMTQYKDKSFKEGGETASVGFFDYPVLMAADIILYDTDVVPVGEDQVQHVELARTLARRFNDRFGPLRRSDGEASETFTIPEARVAKEAARIMRLDDLTKKMSKSAASEYGYIALTDSADMIRKKIKKAVTDSGSEIIYSDAKPALKNLINIYTLLSGKSIEEIQAMYQGKGYGDFKADLAEVVVGFLVPFQERLAAISDDEVLAILRAGAEKARVIAAAKLAEVKEKVGFVI